MNNNNATNNPKCVLGYKDIAENVQLLVIGWFFDYVNNDEIMTLRIVKKVGDNYSDIITSHMLYDEENIDDDVDPWWYVVVDGERHYENTFRNLISVLG